MKIPYHDFPFFRFTATQDLTLYLIQKELQGARFTNELCKLGFDASIYSPDLGVVVLSLVGFTGRTDSLWEWYYQRLDVLAENVDLQDPETAQEIAVEFYHELKVHLKEMQ